jgi:predicted dehydrogenase
MRNNKHVAVELPAALSIKECWSILETAEETRKHCIMLENCIYGENELASLNMTRHNLVGEIFHVEGKYIHDLSKILLSEDGYWNQ